MAKGKQRRKRERAAQLAEAPPQHLPAKEEVVTLGQRERPSTERRSVRKSERNLAKWDWLKTAMRQPVVFVAGVIFGLFVVQWFVSLLPGPVVEATLRGLHVGAGNAAGCTAYMFTVQTDGPVEYVYAKLQFPSQINNFKVGFPQEAETTNAGRMDMQVWEVGRDAKGECTIVQAAVNNDTDVQASSSGNMIAVHASKLPPKALIMGMVATSDSKSSVTPAPEIYKEGAYEYLKLGQTVRKALPISDLGVTEAK